MPGGVNGKTDRKAWKTNQQRQVHIPLAPSENEEPNLRHKTLRRSVVLPIESERVKKFAGTKRAGGGPRKMAVLDMQQLEVILRGYTVNCPDERCRGGGAYSAETKGSDNYCSKGLG